jgi:hypothetical protein
MLSFLTIRDVLWSVLVALFALIWQLDAQVKELEVADSHDTVSLFRQDNATLERELSRHRLRLQHLEARVAAKDMAVGYETLSLGVIGQSGLYCGWLHQPLHSAPFLRLIAKDVNLSLETEFGAFRMGLAEPRVPLHQTPREGLCAAG